MSETLVLVGQVWVRGKAFEEVPGLGQGAEMPRYKYLTVGGGMTADAAVNGIREADPDGSVGAISAEPNPAS